MNENSKYVIFNTSELSSIDFSKVHQKNADRLGYNKDETKFIIGLYDNEPIPSFVDGKTIYTHTEIKNELSKAEWIRDIEN